MRTRSLRIEVSPVSIEDEYLRDFEQHLSYSGVGSWAPKRRLYEFPCEKHGAVSAMRLQIVLEGKTLTLIRAQRASE